MIVFDGEKLKEILKERNISQKELAERAYLTEATISSYITGRRKPTITSYMNILHALDLIDTDLLLNI